MWQSQALGGALSSDGWVPEEFGTAICAVASRGPGHGRRGQHPARGTLQEGPPGETRQAGPCWADASTREGAPGDLWKRCADDVDSLWKPCGLKKK